MCSICGYVAAHAEDDVTVLVEGIFNNDMWEINKKRGRDSFGTVLINKDGETNKFVDFGNDAAGFYKIVKPRVMLANFRAVPTNEYNPNLTRENLMVEQQPYHYEDNGRITWAVHNGTIYNDEEILKDVDRPTMVDSYAVAYAYHHGIQDRLKGGQANAVWDGECLKLYHNYNPLHLYLVEKRLWVFCSSPLEDHLNGLGLQYNVVDIPYYGSAEVHPDLPLHMQLQMSKEVNPNWHRAVVCLSGGLDSTVAATIACQGHREIWLAHFDYGCKATNAEIRAINNITKALREKFPDKIIHDAVIDMSFLKKLGGSTLTEDDAEVGFGKAAVENCIDWVPARNTAFFGLLASFCDRYDIGNIYAGLNLEESGAYPDNSVSFYKAFEQVLQSGSQARPHIRMPLGHLMKHEIAKLGVEIGAPIEHSWSCYHDGDIHCGECGPCYLRRKAFHMNGIEDMIPYKKDYEGMDEKYKKTN